MAKKKAKETKNGLKWKIVGWAIVLKDFFMKETKRKKKLKSYQDLKKCQKKRFLKDFVFDLNCQIRFKILT